MNHEEEDVKWEQDLGVDEPWEEPSLAGVAGTAGPRRVGASGVAY